MASKVVEKTIELNIALVCEPNQFPIPSTTQTTAEDVCITVCRKLGISPVARHLFALRISGTKLFVAPNEHFKEKQVNYDLRVRYKPANNNRLKKADIVAYDYYFHQVRKDVLENKVTDSLYDKFRQELLGLGITDMYRVMIEKDIPQNIVENDYKKYIPKEVIKKHPFFVKKPIHENLGKLRKNKCDAAFIKAQYLEQLDKIAPEYLAEDFSSLYERDRKLDTVIVRVSPDNIAEPSIKICYDNKKENWIELCKIDDLCFVSVRKDNTVEISRKNGIPAYLRFMDSSMVSFVSLLDGYYRLMCKWTFNLCKDVTTPSLKRLHALKCHGPVGGEFSYSKLEIKRNNAPGCFIIRESEAKYNTYFLDVCSKDSKKPKTYKLERLPSEDFIFNDDSTKYRSILQLMQAYSNPDMPIFLKECLPPSEYDQSPLLLCQRNLVLLDSLTDNSNAADLIPKMPVCISSKDLQVYKGLKKESHSGLKVVYRSMWKVTKGKKVEVAMKVLKSDNGNNFLKNFMELCGQWAFLQSSAIVRLYGVTLCSPNAMVMEYLKLGRLDEYLKEHKADIQTVDLIEASSCLASALYHLDENGICHGKIRCRKLLVSVHDENTFKIKLADPGIFISYQSQEVHWIPTECYNSLEYAKLSMAADVWAFATTLWEIFMYGEEIIIPQVSDHNDATRFYSSGKRLPKPLACRDEIYHLMRECWDGNPHGRKRPQAIMRDINQILYQVYNSRRNHSYAKVNPISRFAIGQTFGSVDTLMSTQTEEVLLGSDGSADHLTPIALNEVCSSLSSSRFSFDGHNFSNTWTNDECITSSCDLSSILPNLTFSTASTSLNSINSIQTIFELDEDCNVVLQGRIGQGFYGEVYKGILERIGNMETIQVAVKKLKANALDSEYQDFEREIEIMKSLKHKNIVEILGVKQDPEISLVMEYVPHGSLQSYLKIYRESLSTKQLLKFALDIATGMHYLGSKHIVHRDLATRNILVVDGNHVKISDFGLAQVMGQNEYYILRTNREMPIKWYAPESLRDGKFSTMSDVWSYGVTVCEMFAFGEELTLPEHESSKPTGQEQQDLLTALENGLRFPCPPKCPHVVYVRMIIPCWDKNAHERPKFKVLCNDAEDLLTQY